ncbi:hypothetical protein HBI24_108000 [Parastagonospora nodorum]|nr:hypothetical protein HBH53_063140 [Parastagonospora nodorum]KAH4025290.1 hypothetical protein HBI13_079870 [Parastagonospora nodorum]KAH4172219.1 hypothetical protein HBH44_032280 [Parastagonospora nodorum]KAH4191479.1 hypothetical protein HBH42_125920 [Parastagonospora nodorum]KAH4225039.1 hypothetical protein HBI06_117400 [Parastagonospora nodorum]
MGEAQSLNVNRGARSKCASPPPTLQRRNFQDAKSVPTERPSNPSQSAQDYSDEYTKAVYGLQGISPHHLQRGYQAFRSASLSVDNGAAMKTKSAPKKPKALGRSQSVANIERNSPLVDVPYRFACDEPVVGKNVHVPEKVADEYQRTANEVGLAPVGSVTGRQEAIRKSVRWAGAQESDANKDLRLPRITHRTTVSAARRGEAPERISHSIGGLPSVQSPPDKATTNPLAHASTRGTKLDRTLSVPIRSESVPVKKRNIEQDVNVEAVVKKAPQVISTSRRRLKPLTEVLSRPEPTSEKKPSRPIVKSRSALLVQSIVRDHGHLYSQLQVPPRIESPLPTRTESPQPVTRGTDMSNRSVRADAVSMPVQRAAYAANSTESLMVPKEWLKRGNSISPEYCDIPDQASPQRGRTPLHTKAGQKVEEIYATIDLKTADKVTLAAVLADALMVEAAPSKKSFKKRLGGSLGRAKGISMRSVAGLYGSMKSLMDREVETTPDLTLQITVAEPQEDSFGESTLAALDKAQSKHAITVPSPTP